MRGPPAADHSYEARHGAADLDYQKMERWAEAEPARIRKGGAGKNIHQ